MLPLRDIIAVNEATWPPARVIDLPGWQVRDGAGGGQRVSSATATTSRPDIAAMEAAQAALGQVPLVMIGAGDVGLGGRLAAAGYALHDPVHAYCAPIEALAEAPPPVTAFQVAWPPVRIQHDIWAQGGIGPGRLAVMGRAEGPKCTILGRSHDQPSGTAFVALSDRVAMLHALEVVPGLRRSGTARNIVHGAALWAFDQGAEWFTLLVTQANGPANALYSSLGMERAGSYHYRVNRPGGG